MSQWQTWADKANATISVQRRPASAIDRARMDLDSISEPLPAQVRWLNRVQLSQFAGPSGEASGTLLEFLISIGDMGLYAARDGEAAAAAALGDALLAKGAKPSARMLELALEVGLHNLDGPQRVEAAFRWGAASCWIPQRALAACCAHSRWDESGGEACLELLAARGALASASSDFLSCPAALHPIAAAAMEGDTKTIGRLIGRGVPLGWSDPDTGATLWHVACGLSVPVGKALLPALSKAAPSLAGKAATAAATIAGTHGEPLAIRAGQTPLHCACDGVKPAALAAALACGAAPDMVDSRGDSPLTLLSRRWGAKAQSKAEPMAMALLAAGADPGRKDKNGKTPAQNMAAKGPLGALAALLEARPQDVGSDEPEAKLAFAELSARGAEGLARAEGAAMRSAAGPESPRKPSAGKRRRL